MLKLPCCTRCGSPSLEAPEHLLGGRSKEKLGNPPSYDQAIRLREETPDLSRLNRHDLMRRRDMNLFLGLHPRLLHGPPRLSLPPKPTSTSTRPTPAIPCRAMTCQKPLQPFSDRLPNYCTISGKHICDFEEVDETSTSPGTPGPSSTSPSGDNYRQEELGAKQKGWSARYTRTSTPYSRDSSSDSSQETRLKPSMKGSGTPGPLDPDLSQAEMEDVLFVLRSRVSPTSKDQRRPSLKDDSGIDDVIFHSQSRRSSIDELLEPQGLKIAPQITQVWRTELCRSPSPLENNNNNNAKQQPSFNNRFVAKYPKPPLLHPQHGQEQHSLLKNPLLNHHVGLEEGNTKEKTEEEEKIQDEESRDRSDILLGAILKHSRCQDPDPAIHSVRDTSSYSSNSSTDISPLSPDTPSLINLKDEPVDYNVVDLCQELQSKCLISKHTSGGATTEKENDPNCQNGSMRVRSYSEASSPFMFSFGTPNIFQTLEPLDMSFEDFDDHLSFSTDSIEIEERRSEKRRSSIDEDSVPSANKKAAFRKSFDSATSMVFHSRNGLPLTSSPAPMRRGGIKFDFDCRISTPKDIKRALFESASPEDDSGLGVQTPKKKKQDPRRLLSTSAPATITGNNLLGNFEESVLNGRLEPVSTVEGFTAEIGASGTHTNLLQ